MTGSLTFDTNRAPVQQTTLGLTGSLADYLFPITAASIGIGTSTVTANVPQINSSPANGSFVSGISPTTACFGLASLISSFCPAGQTQTPTNAAGVYNNIDVITKLADGTTITKNADSLSLYLGGTLGSIEEFAPSLSAGAAGSVHVKAVFFGFIGKPGEDLFPSSALPDSLNLADLSRIDSTLVQVTLDGPSLTSPILLQGNATTLSVGPSSSVPEPGTLALLGGALSLLLLRVVARVEQGRGLHFRGMRRVIAPALCRSVIAGLALCIVSLAGPIYDFHSFQVCPGCSTQTGGINNAGLVGVDVNDQGYLYDSKAGTALLGPAGAFFTVPNNNGRVPGALANSDGTFAPIVREPNGTVTTYPGYPGAAFTAFLGLNAAGGSVGYASLDFNRWFSFSRSPTGAYTRIDAPGARAMGTIALGFNEAGTIIGYTSETIDRGFKGFIRNPDGSFQEESIPGALDTLPFAINNSGTIVGGYRDASGWHGFVQMSGVVTTVDFPGAPDTNITGINDLGVLVGSTFDSDKPITGGPFTGFIASPLPEPGTVVFTALGLAFIAARRRFGF